jgi:L-malate glycosyltransferase
MKGGACEALRQISERLVLYGHDVTIATTKLNERKFSVERGITIKEFDIHAISQGNYSGEIQHYQDYLLNSDFDIIMNFNSNVWTTDLMFPIFEKIPAKKIFTPVGFYTLFWHQYREYFEQMKKIVQKYDMCIVNSEVYRDTTFIKENHGKYVVIPNGADEREFEIESEINFREQLHIPENDFLILLVGNHTGYKGHSEAIKIFNRADIPHSTLLIIAGEVYGRVLGPLCNINCNFHQWINHHSIQNKNKKIIIKNNFPRAELIEAYKSANLFLFPSRIECSPVVLFECLASRTPFLTTDVGNAKEIIQWSEAGELLPTKHSKSGFCKADISGSINKLEQLYHDPDQLKKYADNGYRAYKERFTWEKVARLHEEVYKKVLASS